MNQLALSEMTKEQRTELKMSYFLIGQRWKHLKGKDVDHQQALMVFCATKEMDQRIHPLEGGSELFNSFLRGVNITVERTNLQQLS